jgi:diadenosine tetraphosphate (Ap4A) HIT family hydrolase
MVMAGMRSGFAVIGDTQHLPGYSLLLCADASVDHLTDLDRQRRGEFLYDLGLIGEAVQRACRPQGLRRVNYEVLGNSMQWLHGHVHGRYDWEAPDRAGWPVWGYPPEERFAEAAAYSDLAHGARRAAITRALTAMALRIKFVPEQ